MHYKPALVLTALAVAATLNVSCGGGGGGGGNPGSVAPYSIKFPMGNAHLVSGYTFSGAKGMGYNSFALGPVAHPFAWNVTTNAMTDLNPSGYDGAFISGADGVQEVGIGYTSDHKTVGLVWNGLSNKPIQIFPTGLLQVILNAVDNGFQVGDATPVTPVIQHPFVFNGTNSAVDLLPNGFLAGGALCISGNKIGGYVQPTSMTDPRQAALWPFHTSVSFVNLQPVAYTASAVQGISPDQQVGYGVTTQKDTDGGDFVSHALLWTGSAASVVDLNPSDKVGSFANAVRNGVQVGQFYNLNLTNIYMACVWKGTAASMVNLDALIPFDHMGSLASAIDDQGIIYGTYIARGEYHSIAWIPNK